MRRKDDEKLKNIKKAVIKLILDEGFHGTSIAKIAKEAGVSPATVYIYYENKEMMLQDIFLEYSDDIYNYLLANITNNMDGKQLIEVILRSYYSYINDHKDKFHFVEQFSGCPSLYKQCEAAKATKSIYNLLEELKNKNILKNYCSDNIIAVLFSPVKAISNNSCSCLEETEKRLKEIINIIQDALLV